MELLYVLLVAICLILVWRGVTLFMEWRSRLRLKIEPVPPGPEIEITPNPELGKVRVRPRSEPVLAEVHSMQKQAAAPKTMDTQAPEPAVILQEKASPDDRGDVSSVDPLIPETAQGDAGDEPLLLTPSSVATLVEAAEQQDLFADEPIAPPPQRRNTAGRAQALYGSTVVEPVQPVIAAPAEKKQIDIEQVIALHVVSRAHPFNGEDLLRSVLSYGLRYGDMAIFHRHEQPSGQGRVLFSMAKAVEPGTFDLETMTGEEVPGVSFFMGLPGVNSITAYDIMVDTARRLATELQGDVLDEHQQPLTRQLVEHYRERVQEFERRRLMTRPDGR